MADNKIKKSSLQEAKENYEEIQSFAEEAVRKEMEEKIEAKKAEMMEESLTDNEEKEVVEESVTIDANGTTVEIDDDGTVSINPEGGEIGGNEIETDEMPDEMPDEEPEMGEPIAVSADEDPIEVDNDLDELNNENTMQEDYMEEQEPAAPAPAEVPAAAPVEPAAEMPAEVPGEEEVDIVDDTESAVEGDAASQITAGLEQMIADKVAELTGAVGEEAPAAEEVPAEAPVEPAAEEIPMAEDDEIMEIVDEDAISEESVFEVIGEDDMYEVLIPEMEDEIPFDPMAQAAAQADMADEYDETLEETGRGMSHSVKKTGNRTKKMEDMPEKHAPVTALNEGLEKRIEEAAQKAAADIKAQYESKMDELKKENASLTKTNVSLNEEIANYEKSFIDIRKQFDLMETFNAKLAFANQLYAHGGFSKEERMKIAESFDDVKSYDEAESLYNKILKENKVSINKKDTTSKIKQTPTNTVKPTASKEPMYESVEMKRMLELAGVNKNLL